MAKTFSEYGTTGLAEFSGIIRDEFLQELRGKEGYKKLDEMRRNSAIIASALEAREKLIRQISWNFASDKENDPVVDFLEEAREGMSHSWNDHIIEVMTMDVFGFSLFEIVYKRMEDGRIGWRKFAPRGQDTVYQWMFDEDRGLKGIKQLAAPAYKITEIPIEKLLLYRTRVERGNPEGRSLLRPAYIPYYYVKHLQQIEAISAERGGNGFPVITLPNGATTDDNDTSDLGKARIMGRNIRNDEQAAIILPFGWTFEFATVGSGKTIDFNETIRRYESRMMMALLSQFIMIGQNQVGTQNNAETQLDFFSMATDATADIIAETFTHYAIPRLLRLNGIDDGVQRRLEHTPVGDTNKKAVLEMVSKIGERVVWDAEEEVWLRGVLGLPERDLEQVRQQREKLKQEAAKELEAKQAWRKDDNRADFGAEHVLEGIKLALNAK